MANEAGSSLIVDGAGREITIPDNPGIATLASVYAVAVPFVVALKIDDRAVALNPKSNFWKTADSNLANLRSVGRGKVDLEALANLEPTALIHRTNDTATIKAVSKLGIDVICIKVENIDDIKYTLTILGKYFGAEEQASEVTNWIDSKFKKLEEIVSEVPEKGRKTALVMGGSLGRVAGADMLQSWMIEKAGGVPVVKEAKDHNWVNIGNEQIFNYNPDFIFTTSSTALNYSIDEVLRNTNWQSLKSVAAKNIFTIPSKLDSWDIPGLSCILGSFYMLHKMYPDYFGANELKVEANEYYNFMFGKNVDELLDIDWSTI